MVRVIGRVRRGFCGTRGAALFRDAHGRDRIAIAMGAFDMPTSAHLALHIVVAEKGDDYDIDDGLPQTMRRVIRKRPFSLRARFSRHIDESGGTLGTDLRRTTTMNRLDSLSERALDLASSAGGRIKGLAPRATDWLDAGAKLGALKSASKVGVKVVRRNPLVFTAALAGAGLLWYAARRRARRAENGNGQALEGSARRIEVRDGDETGTRARKTGGSRRATGTRRASGSRSRSTSRESRTEH